MTFRLFVIPFMKIGVDFHERNNKQYRDGTKIILLCELGNTSIFIYFCNLAFALTDYELNLTTFFEKTSAGTINLTLNY